MPLAKLNDVDLSYSLAGSGAPLVWVHEYGGDQRSWEPQVRHFAQGFLVLTYNQRGFAPSSVPEEAREYSQELLVADLEQLLKHLNLGPVHVAGCSMGANVARDFAISRPDLTRSLILVGAGAGSHKRAEFLKSQAEMAAGLEAEGIGFLTSALAAIPTRAPFRQKDPPGFAKFLRYAGEHNAQACAHLAREVIMKRKTIDELRSELEALFVPTLIVVGDHDSPCLPPSLALQEWMPHAGLAVLPDCGHTPNLEEPGLFNLLVSAFLASVERGQWAGWSGCSKRSR